MSDEYIIRQIQSGDRSALEKLIERYYDKIYSYCYFHTGNVQTAQDITQDTFLSMMGHLKDYTHYNKFQNYLYVIAGNKCRDYFRKKKPIYMDELPEYEAGGRNDNEIEERLFMKELVDKLPKELKDVVILRFYQDMKYRDIAEILEINISLVKYRVKKAVAVLKEELERS